MKRINIKIESYSLSIIIPENADQKTIFYLNGYDGTENLIPFLSAFGYPSVLIGNNDYEKDFSPYPHAPVFKGGHEFEGKAAYYLKTLTEKIIPKAESYLSNKPEKRGIIGYSLAGLFSIYSLYNTDQFSLFGSVSGSLWYPDFISYLKQNKAKTKPDLIYLSLGDRESQTKNPFLSKAAIKTETAKAVLEEEGPVFFEYNEGGHFIDFDKRIMKCLIYLADSLI